MAISDRLNKLTTDITNAYTSIENKGGTIPANKNTNNLSTAIDSIEVIEQATAEGESLSLTNTKAMPYSDYVVEGKSEQDGEPSPSNPSEIHSVADDVNLFDVGVKNDYRHYTDVSAINWLTVSNDKLSIVVQAEGATMCYNSKQYLGNKTYTITAKTSMVRGRFYVKLRNSTDTGWLTDNDITISNMSYNSYYNGWFIQNQTNTTLILTVNIPDCLYCVFGFGFASDSVGTTQTISNIKLQEGTIATPYSPYNQGTVTIKQRGKNEINLNRTLGTPSNTSHDASNKRLFNYNNYIIGITSNNYYLTSKITSYNVQNNTIKVEVNAGGYGVGFPIKLKPNTSYILSYDTDLEANQNSGIGFYKSDGTYISNTNSLLTNNYLKFTTPSNCDFVIIIFRPPVNTELTYRNIQLEEGSTATDYEPYQGYDKTIQTEPLRSLPNGVRDSLEEDGIHRRVGRVVLDGTETFIVEANYPRFSIALNNCTTKSGRQHIFSNYFKTALIGNDVGIGFTVNGSLFLYPETSITTLSAFQTWLSTHNVEVIYELAEEIIEPLTQNQATTMLDIIKTGSYEGTTNIYTDEDVKPTMKAGYYKKG